MARPTLAALQTIIDEKVQRILALEAQLAELRTTNESLGAQCAELRAARSAPPPAPDGARITERGARYQLRHYGRYWKVAVPRNEDVHAALAEFRAAHPEHAQSTVSVERYDA